MIDGQSQGIPSDSLRGLRDSCLIRSDGSSAHHEDLSSSDLKEPDLESRHVTDVYDAIASHFSATRCFIRFAILSLDVHSY
jgi:hypothetical protein